MIIAEPVEMVHYHHIWLIWLLFFVGEGLHVLLGVDDQARGKKLTRRAIFEGIWVRALYRGFFAALIFAAIWWYPELISQALAAIGHPVGADEASVLAIPMNNILAGAYGLGLDSALGYIPFLKSRLPSTDGQEPKP